VTILDLAHRVLGCGEPTEKVAAAYALERASLEAFVVSPLTSPLSGQPARPKTPVLVPPYLVKKRRIGSEKGRIALLHAVAHIEFNAVDLAADMIARFSLDTRIAPNKQKTFIRDWAKVCQEEAKHFSMVRSQLKNLGSDYGELPAHGGLWAAAIHTQHSIAARLAIAPMVLEARGLDVTPNMIEKLTQVGDHESAAILQVIYDDEIGHVKIGTDWFQYIASQDNENPKDYFRQLVREFFQGRVKPPFNIPARDLAGLEKDYYMGLENIESLEATSS